MGVTDATPSVQVQQAERPCASPAFASNFSTETLGFSQNRFCLAAEIRLTSRPVSRLPRRVSNRLSN